MVDSKVLPDLEYAQIPIGTTWKPLGTGRFRSVPLRIHSESAQKLVSSSESDQKTWGTEKYCLDVWTQFKFQPHNLSDISDSEETDTVKAIPKNSLHEPNGCFDTIVVLRSDEAESTGVEGMNFFNIIF